MWGGRRTKRQRLDDCHERALGIQDGCVVELNAVQWHVQGGARYIVTKLADACTQRLAGRACRDWERCSAHGCVDLCLHMYSCSCPDDDSFICKHVHKVRMLTARATMTPARLAAAAVEDERWQSSMHVEAKVRAARRYLKEIEHCLDRYEEDALEDVIGEVTDDLSSVSAKIHSHCEDFEDAEDDEDDDDDDDDDGED